MEDKPPQALKGGVSWREGSTQTLAGPGLAGEEWELCGPECPGQREKTEWRAEEPQESHQQPLSNTQKGAEALEAAGSVRLKQQEIYSLFKE